ncbi:MAG: hypothetical protein II928_05270 [Paludibacteraceae bacterium]|nr:hypothetical protein [Paludibacteraceae bacterium]
MVKFTWLKYITRISLPMAIVLSVGLLAAWIPSLFQYRIGEVCATAGLMMVNAVILWLAVRQSGGSREYNGLPIIIYMFTITAVPSLHAYWQGQIVASCIMLILLAMHRTYMERENMAEAFRNTLVLYIAALLVDDTIWLVLLLWIGYISLGSMHFRTWLASLLALATAAVWTVIAVYFGWMEIPFTDTIHRAWLFNSLTDYSAWQQLGLMILTGIFLIAAFQHTDRDSIRRRKLIAAFGWIALFGVVLTFWGSAQTLFPLVQAALAGVSVLYLLQRPSEGRGAMFIVFILVCTAMYVLPYFF